MNGFLLDTNVISELTRDAPHPGVTAFLDAHSELWLSAVVLHELDFGIDLLPAGRRRDSISSTLAALVAEFADRVLPLGRPEAAQAATLRVRAHRSGRVLDLGDALIAGTAMANALSVATRNVGDFEGLGLDVVNPWAHLAKYR